MRMAAQHVAGMQAGGDGQIAVRDLARAVEHRIAQAVLRAPAAHMRPEAELVEHARGEPVAADQNLVVAEGQDAVAGQPIEADAQPAGVEPRRQVEMDRNRADSDEALDLTRGRSKPVGDLRGRRRQRRIGRRAAQLRELAPGEVGKVAVRMALEEGRRARSDRGCP